MRTFAMVRNRSSRRSSESAITPSPAIGCRQASTRNTGATLGALRSAAMVGAPSHNSMKRSTDVPSDRVNAVWMCSSRSLGCCTTAGAIAPSEKTREKLMASIAAETSPNSAGLRTRASTATLPTVINPCRPYPAPIHTPLVRACPVRSTGGFWSLEDVMRVWRERTDRERCAHRREIRLKPPSPPSRGRCGVGVGVIVLAVASEFAGRVIQNGAQKVGAGGDQILTGSLGTGPVGLSRPHDQDGAIR